jgi:KDO2-lipid IV(A) lauroyltransferase
MKLGLPGFVRHTLDYAVYVVVRVLICVVQAMRLETGASLAGWLAWLAADVLRIRRKLVEENLRQAFPELTPEARRRLIRRMWDHLFLMVLEIAHAPRKIHETNWRHYVSLMNKDWIVRGMLDDRPFILVTGHLGNFELGGVILGILGFPSYTVARTLDNPYLDRFVNQFRGSSGQYIIPKKGGYDQIEAVMARNGAITLLADQHAGKKGCWVDFFGRPASTHKAIALLAFQYDAPMAVCASTRDGRLLHFRLAGTHLADPRTLEPSRANVRDMTQWFTACLEELIREAPEQYWWLHRRWRQPPVRRKSAGKAAKRAA